MTRSSLRALAVAAAALASTGSAAVAAPGDDTTRWRVSATVSGTYENATGWVACLLTGESALVRERLRVDVRLRPRFVSRFDRRTGMAARLTAGGGGSWTLTGSFPPLVYPPEGGDATCGPPVPVDCAGPVVVRSPRAEIDFAVVGRRAIGSFVFFPEIVESARYAPPDPAKPFCSQNGDEPTPVLPLFGLGSTSLAARAAPTPNTFLARIPVSRLRGRRQFSVLLQPAELEGCPRLSHTTCEETGAIRMRLTFTPARG